MFLEILEKVLKGFERFCRVWTAHPLNVDGSVIVVLREKNRIILSLNILNHPTSPQSLSLPEFYKTDKCTMDTQDNQWQADPNHKPSKTSMWNHSANENGWVHAHNCIRGEIRDMDEAFHSIKTKKTNGLPSWAVEIIKEIWSEHEMHVRSHHENEDAKMTPFMKKRINLPEKLESDHKIVCDCIANMTQAVDKLKEGDFIDELQNLLALYEETMLPHLVEEEDVALPLLMAYFTPKEVARVVRSFTSTKSELGSFVHYQTVEGFRNKFMKQEGIPGFVWILLFKPGYNYFLEHVKKPLDVLKAGEEPAPKTMFWCCAA